MTPQETLWKAAEYIEKHGWCQYAFEDSIGRCCVYGAINRSGGDTKDDLDAADAQLAKYLGLAPGECALIPWNDEPGRTAEEVIAALREAAVQG